MLCQPTIGGGRACYLYPSRSSNGKRKSEKLNRKLEETKYEGIGKMKQGRTHAIDAISYPPHAMFRKFINLCDIQSLGSQL